MEKDPNNDPVFVFEQLESHARNVVIIIADYYHQLIEKKVPPDLAHKLTVDFQMFLWQAGQKK